MAKDLPPRENTLFKRLVKCYENKQYKTGLKHARQILSNSKFQEHGETLAMMGLTLNCLGRKEEAYDNVKRGLRNNLQSHVCWHVFGLLQRSDKKYEEAIKCYRNALRWDKDNLQILRDLSLLQIQTRDLEGYKMTRHQLLMLRANQRAGWVGYAIAQHILGEPDNALNVLQTFRKTQEGKPGDYEFSELLLYEASIMVEAGKYKQALNHILTNRNSIVDIQSWLEMAGDLYYKLGQFEESANVHERLIHRNPENSKHLENHINAKQPGSTEAALEICEQFRAMYPKADAPLNYALKHSSGETFKIVVDGYLRRQLTKGVTPLFNILKHLFTDKTKLETIEELMLGYHKSLEEHKKFNPEDEDTELPTSYLHVLIFLAQLYDYKLDTNQALLYINKAIMHTPTYIDPYMVKSKIYKHAANPTEAVTWMEEARTLDLADRYLNSKCAKYMLRAGMLDKAEETCALFTREGQAAVDNLNEMQCMWFLTECARTYARNQDFANTLRKCHEVEKHFVDIVEDQFDFHPYSMRKMTLRAYIGLLRLENEIRGHAFYNKAAELAIRTYLHLYDKPLAATNGHGDGETDQMSEKEKKKLESKKKRAAKKKQQQKQEAAPKDNNQTKKIQGDGELVPPPISGEELVKTESPLDEATKFLEHLKNLSPKYPATHKLAFEIYFRKGKILLMIQSIKRAMKVCPDSPEILLNIPKLCHFVKSADISNGTVAEIVKSEMSKLLPNNNIDNWLDCKHVQYNDSFKHYFMICCARSHISPESVEHQRSLVLQHDLTNIDLKSLQFVYEHLQQGMLGTSSAELEQFAAKCHKLYPIASLFKPKEEEESVNR